VGIKIYNLDTESDIAWFAVDLSSRVMVAGAGWQNEAAKLDAD
jgi:hypothetical protein